MQQITTITGMVALREQWRAQGCRVGLVPTMGNLHAGHLRLVEDLQRHCDRMVVSIFVNPLQFSPGEDFARYPRTLAQDLEQLARHQVAAVFTPNASDFYPPEFQTQVSLPALSDTLCGTFRPGHFTGVATVVLKFLNVVQPQVAIFGSKDYQQLIVIERMVSDLAVPTRVLRAATVRETDGLAMSSRNQYLSVEQRRQAPALYRVLSALRQRIEAGERGWAALEKQALAELESAGFRPQYVSVRRALDLSHPDDNEINGELVILAAAYLGETRLIDNVNVRQVG